MSQPDSRALRGRAAMVGFAEATPTKTPEGRTPLQLVADVSIEALADAGLAPADVDGLVVCPRARYDSPFAVVVALTPRAWSASATTSTPACTRPARPAWRVGLRES